MDLYIPFPDMTPSTILSFAADGGPPVHSGRNRWNPYGRRPLIGASAGGESTAALDIADLDDIYNRSEDPGLTLRYALEGDVEDLSDQEDRVYRAETNLRATGEEVLMPIGRMQTAQEVARARSESPSEPGDRDHMQEDNQAERDVNMQEISVDQSVEAEPQDLDADMEDHDVSGQQADESM